MDRLRLEFLKKKALGIRKKTIEIIGHAGIGHIGGAMSIVEVLTALYYEVMRVDPANPKMPDRDRLILSKGHAGPALYVILADMGFFPEGWLLTLNEGGTHLPSHCDMNETPGVDMTTGSLGQGLSAAVGLCLSNRISKLDRRVFAIIGDGESNEGEIWEAAMSAAHFKLDRLIAFTDYNKMQIDGYTDDIMSLGDLDGKWKSFGWHVQHIDGHDIEGIVSSVQRADSMKGIPSMIILDTIKGKGCSFAEGKTTNHCMVFDRRQAAEAVALLDKGK